MLMLALFVPLYTTGAVTTMLATDARVEWSGRHTGDATTGAVSFDWLSVTARVGVHGATYVRVVSTAAGATRTTRIKAYASDQGFQLYPAVQFWIPRSDESNATTVWQSGGGTTTITLENIVDPQYRTGITTFHSFTTDGTFVPPAPRSPTMSPTHLIPTGTRRLVTIGDSITSATNILRPEGSPQCGDGGYQSDWSKSYSALLCHRFGAECSTIAVGGKCMMRECGGLQMPDYYGSAFYADRGAPTFIFAQDAAPHAMLIDLGTNDMRAITKIGLNTTTGEGPGMAQFATEMVAFLVNVTTLYQTKDIQFFLSSGPMENTTITGTQSAVAQARALGIKATWIDMRTACVDARIHGAGDSDMCDGCHSHPGVEGHRGMYEAAWPVIEEVMGWTEPAAESRGAAPQWMADGSKAAPWEVVA